MVDLEETAKFDKDKVFGDDEDIKNVMAPASPLRKVAPEEIKEESKEEPSKLTKTKIGPNLIEECCICLDNFDNEAEVM